jgi:hypothetical protein
MSYSRNYFRNCFRSSSSTWLMRRSFVEVLGVCVLGNTSRLSVQIIKSDKRLQRGQLSHNSRRDGNTCINKDCVSFGF